MKRTHDIDFNELALCRVSMFLYVYFCMGVDRCQIFNINILNVSILLCSALDKAEYTLDLYSFFCLNCSKMKAE